MPSTPQIGYFLSCEEYTPAELLEQARLAEEAGFECLWISDHFHPWNDEQGESAFVWSIIGAISRVTDLPVTTGVTAPIIRYHPAIVAQAAATSGALLRGGFALGVGTGEALNEHVVGARWPTADVRLEMLEESIGIIRELLSGERVDHHGTHYDVEDARLYTLPERPVPIFVSGFGPKAIELAARIGDGFCTVQPNAEHVELYRKAGGKGPIEGGTKFCWGPDRDAAVQTAHRLWKNQGLPGELSQILPSVRHFEQASSLVTPEMIGSSVPCGPDVEPYLDTLQSYADAGFTTIHIAQMGQDQEGFFRFWDTELRDALKDL